jgi:hypothetical protein
LPNTSLCGKNTSHGEKMRRKVLSGISILIIVMLTACGAAPKPTLSVTDIQNTAFPIVMTQYAMTKAALPTATPIPPTSTETPTFAPLPTSALGTPIVVAPPSDPNATPTPNCYTPPTPKLKGATLQLNLVNRAGGLVNLSMGMYKPNDQGECFTFAFSVRDKQTLLIKILSGCYWIGGYQLGSKPSTPRNDYICLSTADEGRGLTIGKDSVGFN